MTCCGFSIIFLAQLLINSTQASAAIETKSLSVELTQDIPESSELLPTPLRILERSARSKLLAGTGFGGPGLVEIFPLIEKYSEQPVQAGTLVVRNLPNTTLLVQLGGHPIFLNFEDNYCWKIYAKQNEVKIPSLIFDLKDYLQDNQTYIQYRLFRQVSNTNPFTRYDMPTDFYKRPDDYLAQVTRERTDEGGLETAYYLSREIEFSSNTHPLLETDNNNFEFYRIKKGNNILPSIPGNYLMEKTIYQDGKKTSQKNAKFTLKEGLSLELSHLNWHSSN